MAHGSEGIHDALAATTGDQARMTAEQDQEREERKAAYDSERPMEQYQPRPSCGGHGFGSHESQDATAPKPRLRVQSSTYSESDADEI